MRVEASGCSEPAPARTAGAAWVLWAVLSGAAVVLAGCGAVPKGSVGRDGPAAQVPPDLATVPDAEPRLESIRPGGPNKPYEVLGKRYTPETRDLPLRESGLASWYGRKFHGRKTASGEIYNMHAMTAAHKTMPLPSYARVRNPANGREVVVRINDRGPFVAGRVIDLSYTAALKLDLLRGVGRVEVERITFDDVRTGAWRRGVAPAGEAVAAAATAPGVPTPGAPVPVALPGAAEVADAPGPAEGQTPGDAAAAGASMPPPRPAEAATAAPTVPAVRVEPGRALTAGARGYWVQLGAFRERGGAEDFHQRVAGELDWLAPLLAVFNETPLWRLQAGPYPAREDAQGAAQRVREALQLMPVIVEKR